jgi:Ca2+-binding EF-hand superfamily protein
MTQLSAVLTKIKRGCQVSGVTLTDIISEYDRQRTGFVAPICIHRAFPRYGIRLTDQEYEALEIEFKSGDVISVHAFADALENAGTTHVQNPHREVAAELRELAHELRTHQQTIWDCAKPLNRRNREVISAEDLLRAFSGKLWAKPIADAFADRERGEISLVELDFALKTAVRETRPPEPMAKPPQVLRAIDHVVRRAIEIRSAFEAKDRLRKGKLPIETFAMVLSTFSGIRISPSDIQIVANFYSQNEFADYLAFLKDVNEASETVQPPLRTATVEVDLATILNRLKALFVERRIAPIALFPHNRLGTISKYNFERILTQTATILRPEEVKAISSAFTAGNNEVNYEDFASYFVRSAPIPEDISPVLDVIRSTLIEHKLQLRPVLVKLSRNVSDDVSRTQLIVGLQNSSIVLDTEEIDGLLREFPGSVPGTVSLSVLCDAVDPDLPTSPPLSAPSPRAPPKQMPVAPTPVLDVVMRLGHDADSLGVDLHQEFRRLDRLRHGRVAESQFRAVIGLLSGRIDDYELRTVFTQYHVADGFDYLSFCRDAAMRPTESHMEETEELLAVLRKCKAVLGSKMVPMDDLFKRFDPSGIGFIPVSAICRAFGDYGLLLTPAELALIGNAFKDRRAGDKVNATEFKRRLQTLVLPRQEHQTTLFRAWSHEEYERVLSSVKTELREKLHVRPRAFRRVMAKVRQGVVTVAEFLDAIDEAGVVLKREQIDVLVQCYRLPNTENIDFIRFAQEIEKIDLMGAR